MKKHIIIFCILLLVTLSVVLSGIAPVQAETAALQGGNFVLIPQSVNSSNALAGGSYQLSPASPQADTSGCCCKGMLPCILR